MALPWWAWAMLAGLLALAEMHMPGSYLVWIALGAAATSLLYAAPTSLVHAAFGAALEGQLGTFVAASALSCAMGFFVYRRLGGGSGSSSSSRRRRGEAALNQRHLAMLGARGTTCEAFANGLGKVRLGDSVWLAAGPDLAEGAPVVVSGVRGTRLVVEPARPRPAADAANTARAS